MPSPCPNPFYLKHAISNYPSVRESLENLFVAKQSIAIAEALGKGQSSVTLSGGYQRDDGTTDPAGVAQLSYRQILFDDGEISENVKVDDIRGNFTAEKLYFDISKQTLNIASSKKGKINANINIK